MTSEPLISVIVPVYRTEPYLRRCVDSILTQVHYNLELILIDDGSPDGCPVICDTYAASDPRVRVVHQVNKGPSAARNAGLDIARGNYISFVDSDDWVDPDYLSYLLHLLDKSNSSIAACNHFVNVNGKDYPKFPLSGATRRMTRREAFENLLYHRPPDASSWGKLYHESVFERLRYPEGKIFEDTYLIADIIDAAGEMIYGGRPLYHYLYRDNTLSKGAMRERKWDYLDAAEHMAEVILVSFPDLQTGCVRRRVHAALSIRRLLVHADESQKKDLERCQKIIRADAWNVLRDGRAPLRDKLGILLVLAGPRAFDLCWELYRKRRRDY